MIFTDVCDYGFCHSRMLLLDTDESYKIIYYSQWIPACAGMTSIT